MADDDARNLRETLLRLERALIVRDGAAGTGGAERAGTAASTAGGSR